METVTDAKLTKTCWGCNTAKPLGEFHPTHRKRNLGRMSWGVNGIKYYCLECNARLLERAAACRAKNTERVRRYKDKYPERVAARNLKAQRRSREKYPEKWSARSAVAEAIKKGILIRPETCSSCRGNPNGETIQAHHESYAKDRRLDVIWLCRTCHRHLHAKYAFRRIRQELGN